MSAYRSWLLWPALVTGYLACSDEPPAGPSGSSSSAGGASATTTATTTSVSTTSSSGGSGGGDAPIMCADVYTDVTQGECDFLRQDCSAGETCVPQETAGRWEARCVEAPGLKGSGKPCIVPAECEAGLFCIGSPQGRCTPACCPSTDEPCGNGLCNQRVNFGGAFLWTCTFNPQCQLFLDTCSGEDACHVSDPEQGLATCVPQNDAQEVDEGQPCRFLNECKTMQHCSAAEGGVCRYYCYVSALEDLPPGRGGCPEGQGCAEVDFGVQGIGLCALR